MNFKFENNIENKTVTIEVVIPPRKNLKEERKRVKFNDVLELFKQNYNPPDTYTLGECTSNIHIRLDNDYKNSLVGKWTFSLKAKKTRAIKPLIPNPTRKSKTKSTKKA